MTLKEFRESYHSITDKASTLARGTNYSLIAIVWILCDENISNIDSFKWVLLWLLLSLVMDFFQYLVPAIIGTIKYRCEEKKVKDKSQIDDTPTEGYPNCTPWITSSLFILKFNFSLKAVICLLCVLF